ncbi:hypothetical protein DFH09DRAFT_1105052 [Mycena vulgaris]|nr:hypothetical protein DFH09DRAFT_1105052 [Mycena vulgaris]
MATHAGLWLLCDHTAAESRSDLSSNDEFLPATRLGLSTYWRSINAELNSSSASSVLRPAKDFSQIPSETLNTVYGRGVRDSFRHRKYGPSSKFLQGYQDPAPITDPFRQGLGILPDGTATGRFDELTAVEMTAVKGMTGGQDRPLIMSETRFAGNQGSNLDLACLYIRPRHISTRQQ